MLPAKSRVVPISKSELAVFNPFVPAVTFETQSVCRDFSGLFAVPAAINSTHAVFSGAGPKICFQSKSGLSLYPFMSGLILGPVRRCTA